MQLAAEYQARVSRDGGAFWSHVGGPQPSEALAWQQVHECATILWPESAPSRRSFESRCKVIPIVRVPVR